MGGIRYLKGHGTGNDFVLFPDPVELTPELVAAVCDRRTGIGADGVLAVVATGGEPAYFMDYRNADGSLAEMCGNGVRVFARYLVDAGLVRAGRFEVATRAGDKQVEVDGEQVSVWMGRFEELAPGQVSLDGRELEAAGISMGNPHLVVRVDSPEEAGKLSIAPGIDRAAYPDGANVEFVTVLGKGRLGMRVFERGVGETQSCGTGACAAAATYTVLLPGGELTVGIDADREVTLTGPAVLVAEGELRADWLAAAGGR